METIPIKCPHCNTIITASQEEVYAGFKCAACRQMIHTADLMEEVDPRAKAIMTHRQFIQYQMTGLLDNTLKVFLSMNYLADKEAEKSIYYRRAKAILWKLKSKACFLVGRLCKDDNINLVQDYQASLVNSNFMIVSEVLDKLSSEPLAISVIKDEWQNDVKRFKGGNYES